MKVARLLASRHGRLYPPMYQLARDMSYTHTHTHTRTHTHTQTRMVRSMVKSLGSTARHEGKCSYAYSKLSECWYMLYSEGFTGVCSLNDNVSQHSVFILHTYPPLKMEKFTSKLQTPVESLRRKHATFRT
jgi:hypothetical protein